MRMSLGKVLVNLFKQRRLRNVPESRIMAESAVLPLTYPDHFLMAKWVSTMESLYRLRDAGWVVKHAKRIHHGIETQATAKGAHLIGKAGTQEKQTVAIGDGLLQRINTYFCQKLHA